MFQTAPRFWSREELLTKVRLSQMVKVGLWGGYDDFNDRTAEQQNDG